MTLDLYVGRASDYVERTTTHLSDLNTTERLSNPVLGLFLDHYEPHNFLVIRLKEVFGYFEKAKSYETYYIELFSSLYPNGYNCRAK